MKALPTYPQLLLMLRQSRPRSLPNSTNFDINVASCKSSFCVLSVINLTTCGAMTSHRSLRTRWSSGAVITLANQKLITVSPFSFMVFLAPVSSSSSFLFISWSSAVLKMLPVIPDAFMFLIIFSISSSLSVITAKGISSLFVLCLSGLFFPSILHLFESFLHALSCHK